MSDPLLQGFITGKDPEATKSPTWFCQQNLILQLHLETEIFAETPERRHDCMKIQNKRANQTKLLLEAKE